MPVLEDGRPIWREFRHIDTSRGAFPDEMITDEIATPPDLRLGGEEFAAIARQALANGIGVGGRVGEGESYLFPARDLHQFAEVWLEAWFG